MEQWVPLNREQVLAARDCLRAGQTVIDYRGESHGILYSILTPLGYQTHVSVQALKHMKKHPIAAKHERDIAHILNNPDLITPSPEDPKRHIFYKSLGGKTLFAMEIRIIDTVVEFIFGPSKHLVYGDEDWWGLDVGRDRRSKKVVGYMSLSFPQLYRQILKGLKKRPIPGRFSVESLVDTGNVTPICDPRVKNATFAEIVQWVWEKYYAHLEAGAKVGAGP